MGKDNKGCMNVWMYVHVSVRVVRTKCSSLKRICQFSSYEKSLGTIVSLLGTSIQNQLCYSEFMFLDGKIIVQYFDNRDLMWEKGWRSGESTRLPLMWLGFDFDPVPYLGWVCFWFSPCSEGVSLGMQFSFLLKNQLLQIIIRSG